MKFGGYTGVTPSVHLSVCPCVTKSGLGHNFKSINASKFKLHTQIGHTGQVVESIVYKNHNSIPTIFSSPEH